MLMFSGGLPNSTPPIRLARLVSRPNQATHPSRERGFHLLFAGGQSGTMPRTTRVTFGMHLGPSSIPAR